MTEKVKELTLDDAQVKEFLKGFNSYLDKETSRWFDIYEKVSKSNDPQKVRKMNDLKKYRDEKLYNQQIAIRKIMTSPWEKAKELVIQKVRTNPNDPMVLDTKQKLMNIPSDGLTKTFLDNPNLYESKGFLIDPSIKNTKKADVRYGDNKGLGLGAY